jgi:hypothetical protein
VNAKLSAKQLLHTAMKNSHSPSSRTWKC